jgi:hypothetical protein
MPARAIRSRVVRLNRISPAPAASATRAATFTVAPYQSLPRWTAVPLCTPIRSGGHQPSLASSRRSRIATATTRVASLPWIITASPRFLMTSQPHCSAMCPAADWKATATSAAMSSPTRSVKAV